MPTIKITADLGRFKAALRNVMAATKKTEAEIVNRAARNIAFRAASFTPKANQQAVIRQLTYNGLLPALASINLNKRLGKNSKGKKVWGRAQHSAEMLRIIAARRRGVGAIRAGWIPAIEQLGGTYRGAKLRSAGSAAAGYALKATVSDLSAIIANAVEVKDYKGRAYSANEIALATSALDRAVAFVTDDMEGYAIQKINETLAKEGD